MSQNQILFFIFLFCLNPFLGTLSLLIVKMMINKRDIYNVVCMFAAIYAYMES